MLGRLPPSPQPELGKRAVRILCFIFSISYILQKYWQQVCIPVGCVPPAYFPYLPAYTDPGGGGSSAQTPSPPWTEFLTHASENITLSQQHNSRSATVSAKIAYDYSALRRVPSLVRNLLCEYSTLPNLVEFKTENKESYLEIFLKFNGLIQKDAVVMFQFFDILDTNFVFSSSVNIHISLLCMVRNDALMRFHIQDGIDSGGGYG